VPIIRILIDKKGRITIDAEGFVGKSCLIATEKLEKILKEFGVSLNNKQVHLKPEYHVKEGTLERVQA